MRDDAAGGTVCIYHLCIPSCGSSSISICLAENDFNGCSCTIPYHNHRVRVGQMKVSRIRLVRIIVIIRVDLVRLRWDKG